MRTTPRSSRASRRPHRRPTTASTRSPRPSPRRSSRSGRSCIGGYLGPLAIIALAILPAAVIAGVAGRLVRISFLLTLPIAISVVLVSVFTRAGTTVLFTIGPFDATAEGVDFAGQTLVRLFAISTSIGLFGLTTEPRSFVLDLERRGLSPRFAFVALATLEAVPAMVERASVIQAAQRARGLDTEGSVRARLRGRPAARRARSSCRR